MLPAEILKKIKNIHIRTKHLVNASMAGEYESVFRGRGMEFEEVREYQPGDEIRSIDWNVTARMGTPFVKKYKEERELTVMLVVDVSFSGRFGTVNCFKNELAELDTLKTKIIEFDNALHQDFIRLRTLSNDYYVPAGIDVSNPPSTVSMRLSYSIGFFVFFLVCSNMP